MGFSRYFLFYLTVQAIVHREFSQHHEGYHGLKVLLVSRREHHQFQGINNTKEHSEKRVIIKNKIYGATQQSHYQERDVLPILIRRFEENGWGDCLGSDSNIERDTGISSK